MYTTEYFSQLKYYLNRDLLKLAHNRQWHTLRQWGFAAQHNSRARTLFSNFLDFDMPYVISSRKTPQDIPHALQLCHVFDAPTDGLLATTIACASQKHFWLVLPYTQRKELALTELLNRTEWNSADWDPILFALIPMCETEKMRLTLEPYLSERLDTAVATHQQRILDAVVATNTLTKNQRKM